MFRTLSTRQYPQRRTDGTEGTERRLHRFVGVDTNDALPATSIAAVGVAINS